MESERTSEVFVRIPGQQDISLGFWITSDKNGNIRYEEQDSGRYTEDEDRIDGPETKSEDICMDCTPAENQCDSVACTGDVDLPIQMAGSRRDVSIYMHIVSQVDQTAASPLSRHIKYVNRGQSTGWLKKSKLLYCDRYFKV